MSRQALIDADILSYELAFSSQKMVDGELEISSWEFTQELLERRIDLILDETFSDQPPKLYLTNSTWLNTMLNRRDRLWTPEREYVPNFRIAAAEGGEEKTYKGGRKVEKPFHYYNLLAYMLSSYDCVVSRDGLEADDLMCIEQISRLDEADTIICSRDKDLRQCHGWYYSWEVGKQASIGPLFIEGVGDLTPKWKATKTGKSIDKMLGTGPKFFYYQMLVGDAVDNIAGLYGYGPAFAYNLLRGCSTERECYEAVAECYKKEHGDSWKDKITTQAHLLWLIKKVDDNGNPIWWQPPRRVESI